MSDSIALEPSTAHSYDLLAIAAHFTVFTSAQKNEGKYSVFPLNRLRPRPLYPIHLNVNTKIEIPLTDDEWSMLNAAADSIQAKPEELARISLLQRCIVMSEDDDICEGTRFLLGKDLGLN